MNSEDHGGLNPEHLQQWFDRLKSLDPALHADLSRRLGASAAPTPGRVVPEFAPAAGLQPAAPAVALETIVREGRPALLIKGNKIQFEDPGIDQLSEEMVGRVKLCADMVEPVIPAVGRIDVANFAGTAKYLGTGWMIEADIVVTNRHVAELVARRDGGSYRFRPGRFGEPMRVSIDYFHELDSSDKDVVNIESVVWIEPDPKKADLALLKVKQRENAKRPIDLADADAAEGTNVVVIGYPARAPADIIPDQAWMDRIYGSAYDVKRIAPGLITAPSRGWATHDCTTLGGNSGSVVVDMVTGRAVALHFAGLYMIENYAVPASALRRYLRERPWQGRAEHVRQDASHRRQGASNGAQQSQQSLRTLGQDAIDRSRTVSIDIPLRIEVTLGTPHVPTLSVGIGASQPTGLDEVVREFERAHREAGILAVRPGYTVDNGRLTETDCIVVAVHPDRIAEVRASCPIVYGGYPVAIRAASVQDQLVAVGEVAAEAVTSVMYDDDARSGPDFSFDEIDEEMKVICHVGPERSWEVLKPFLAGTKHELVSSMYEFHAKHISDEIEGVLRKNAKLTIALDAKTRNPRNGQIAAGDFDRRETFERWAEHYDFSRIFVPTGSSGLVASSYHIKVTVRDGSAIWLSSGNWKRSSQPIIPSASRDEPAKTGRAGNREWHVVIENETLAKRLGAHVLADYQHSGELGGTLEAVEDEVFVDVPVSALEAVQLEAPPAEVLEPLEIMHRRVRVTPLLTPDRQGAVFSEAVLRLIRSARKQLVFQNQYINMGGASGGFLKQLVELLVRKSNELDDFRMILRSEGDGFWDNVSALKRLGLDIESCVRRLPSIHTKGIVVDGKRVLIGSHNWSSLGVTLNRDASLIFEDQEIAKYFLRAFEIDWDRASELSLAEAIASESPRLATGVAPPAGFKRITLGEYLEG